MGRRGAGETGVAGFELGLGEAGIEGVQVIPRLPEIELPTEIAGGEVALSEFGAKLTAPVISPTGAAMRIVILGAGECMTQPVAPGKPVILDAEIDELLSELMRFRRLKLLYYYFEEQPAANSGALARRSKLDRLRLSLSRSPSPGQR